MGNDNESRLTQSFLGLTREELYAVPALQKELADTINKYIDAHHVSMGTVATALAFVVGEFIMECEDHAEGIRKKFLEILNAHISTGISGARIGPDTEPSLVRRWKPWRS
jgi:hypothetical protein